ncbi:MAG TPA: LapA family protein [Ideonella sp.]|uniref:LapA family protein n=1 Tax=Ideonella sp. TaxID=1929293 RepID=UPI002C7C28DF|nr:LapA family protein [Ideonella sp.]HSI47890.1 LapA family protein [Ideonella sp.]
MHIFVWLFRAFIFFSLFAFALNNQQPAAVNWFFGHAWTAPMVIIVLCAFAGGTAFGVLAMAPSWWRQRRRVRQQLAGGPVQQPASSSSSPTETPATPPLPDVV